LANKFLTSGAVCAGMSV